MSKKTVWRQVTRSCILSLLSISLENMSQEIEIGLGKKGRLAYSLDDVSIVPSRRTRDPQDVSTSWQVDAYEFDVPVIGAPMDSVTSPATAIAMGKMARLACSTSKACGPATTIRSRCLTRSPNCGRKRDRAYSADLR